MIVPSVEQQVSSDPEFLSVDRRRAVAVAASILAARTASQPPATSRGDLGERLSSRTRRPVGARGSPLVLPGQERIGLSLPESSQTLDLNLDIWKGTEQGQTLPGGWLQRTPMSSELPLLKMRLTVT